LESEGYGKGKMKKVELLAPAGNYESFLGAVHAGADAVYLGGAKFGARAYAENFTKEEICRAIRYAHIYKRKVYLTLNTLVKEREFHEVYEYLRPFYDAGLDGVIIQDLGVFFAVGEWFPHLPRHISTQMTVTGSLGAAYLKSLGAKRIVPARELSLAEIVEMKKETDIEVETFIHGAVCYCYSGQCLFSSILGGRSGNRGRCAQPCRLPYGTGKQEGKKYPLSLKDMCTIELLGQLIEAGIDSFKIEGRMKSPEYAAGTTGIYRKYIDRYYENPQNFYVEKHDIEKLKALYIRGEISQGYYYKHNGKDMITLKSPGYTGKDEVLERQVREAYLERDMRLPVLAKAKLMNGEEAALSLESCGVQVTVKGDKVQKAEKQPLTEESVRKQLNKLGNTAFYSKKLTIQMTEDGFLPIKALNDLRRKAIDKLEEEIIRANGFGFPERGTVEGQGEKEAFSLKIEKGKAGKEETKTEETQTGEAQRAEMQKERTETAETQEAEVQKEGTQITETQTAGNTKPERLHALALTKEQCFAAIGCGVERLYIDANLCQDTAWIGKLQEMGRGAKLYLALPYIVRQKDRAFLEELFRLSGKNLFSGILVRNLEEMEYWKERIGKSSDEISIVTDATLYVWNKKTLYALGKDCVESYLPYELNIHELKENMDKGERQRTAVSVYGRVPMMVSANCVAATMERCRKKGAAGTGKEGFFMLTDRYGKVFPVYLNCKQCYNVIYNSLPLSHHKDVNQLAEVGISSFRLDFTTENGNETEKIIRFWQGLIQGQSGNPPYREYTKGHLHRGAE